jgi:hypothetical protein
VSEGQEFSLLHVVHPTSYTMNSGVLSPAVKRPGRESDLSPPASAEVKKIGIYTFTPPHAFMEQCLISYAKG